VTAPALDNPVWTCLATRTFHVSEVTQRVRPGAPTLSERELGAFWGIRESGRLVASKRIG